jgi:hypothetical protein
MAASWLPPADVSPFGKSVTQLLRTYYGVTPTIATTPGHNYFKTGIGIYSIYSAWQYLPFS